MRLLPKRGKLPGSGGSQAGGDDLNRGEVDNDGDIDAGDYNVLNSICGTVDFDKSGTVDFFDFLDFPEAHDEELPVADMDCSGTIDFFDYLDFSTFYDNCD